MKQNEEYETLDMLENGIIIFLFISLCYMVAIIFSVYSSEWKTNPHWIKTTNWINYFFK